MRVKGPAERHAGGDSNDATTARATALDRLPPVLNVQGREVAVRQQTPQHVGSLTVPEHHIAAVPPIVSGDYILAGCLNGDVVAWKTDFLEASPPILHSLDTLTGREPDIVWQCNISSPVACISELLEDVVVATEAGYLYRILFPALKLKHTFHTHRCGISAMLAMDDKIILGFKTGFVEAYALNGTKLWEGLYEDAEIGGLAHVKDHLVVTLKYYDNSQRPATASMVEIIDTSNLKGEVDLSQHVSLLLPGREIVDASYLTSRPQCIPSLGTNRVLSVHNNTIATSLADGSYVELSKSEQGWQTTRQLCLPFPSIGMGQVVMIRNGEPIPHAVCCSRATSTLLIPILSAKTNLPILAFAMPHDLDDDLNFRYLPAATSFTVRSAPMMAYVFSCGVVELFSCELRHHPPHALVLQELHHNGSFELLRQFLASNDTSAEQEDAARDAAREAAREAARAELKKLGHGAVSCDDLCYSLDLEAVRSFLLELN